MCLLLLLLLRVTLVQVALPCIIIFFIHLDHTFDAGDLPLDQG